MSVLLILLVWYLGLPTFLLYVYIYIYVHSKMKREIVISKSKKPDKKLDARIEIKKMVSWDRRGHPITPHIKIKSENNRMSTDIDNEYWTKSGVKAAGWMIRNTFWNKPTLQASVADINKV